MVYRNLNPQDVRQIVEGNSLDLNKANCLQTQSTYQSALTSSDDNHPGFSLTPAF